MALLRPSSSSAVRASRSLAQLTHHNNTALALAAVPRPSSYTPSSSFSTTAPAPAADHAHGAEDQYDPPSGWLWGIRPGDKYQKEGWEGIWVWGFFGSLGLGVVAYAFKPDTSIQTWALEEARRRLEAEGILKEPESKS